MSEEVKPIYVISDPEGYDIETMFDKPKDGNFDLYICGDLTDSTFIGKFDDPKLSAYINLKSNNLKNIYNVVNNDNYNLVLGNRDLNKLKCLLLCELNNDDNSDKGSIISKFNNGNIDLTEEAFNELKEAINTNITNKKGVWKHQMKKFYPFWNGGIETYKKTWDKDDSDTDYFKDRFDKIFGLDGSTGTMSAGNLLITIIQELNNIKILNTSNTSPDFESFVVLAIYRSMLMGHVENDFVKEFSSTENFKAYCNKKLKSYNNVLNSNIFYAWLSKLYNKSSVVEVIAEKSNMYIFSHGGINHPMLSNKLSDNDFLKNINTAMFTDPSKLKPPPSPPQKGGFHSNTKTGVSANDVQLYCNETNEYFTSLILQYIRTYFLSYNNKVTLPNKKKNYHECVNSLIKLIILSGGFNYKNFKNKLENQETYPEYSFITEDVSPIIFTDGKKFRGTDNMFTVNGYTTYQFVGHIPLSYTSTIELYQNQNKNDKTILIYLDTSNSFKGTTVNLLNNNNKLQSMNYSIINSDGSVSNKSVIALDNSTPNIKTSTPNIKTYDIAHINDMIVPELSHSVYISSSLISKAPYNSNFDNIQRIVFTLYNNIDPNDNSDILATNGTLVVSKNKNKIVVDYNGTGINSSGNINSIININTFSVIEKDYVIVTIRNGFLKALLILSNDDFKNFTSELKKISKPMSELEIQFENDVQNDCTQETTLLEEAKVAKEAAEAKEAAKEAAEAKEAARVAAIAAEKENATNLEKEEAARTAKEAARTAEEAAKKAAEVARTAEEAAKKATATKAEKEEATRTAAEATRTAAEATRTAAEATRTAAEATRAAAEATRAAAEATRAVKNKIKLHNSSDQLITPFLDKINNILYSSNTHPEKQALIIELANNYPVDTLQTIMLKNDVHDDIKSIVYNIIANKTADIVSLLGGSKTNNDNKFKNKYLKYKTKYVELQQEMKIKKLI